MNRVKIHEDAYGTLLRFWIGGDKAYWNYQESTDGGQNWSQIAQLNRNLMGEQGLPALVNDNLGRTHLFIGQRGRNNIPSTTIGLWHMVWDGSTWSEQVRIPESNPDNLPTAQYYLFNPSASLSAGNQVFITWWANAVGEIFIMEGEIQDIAGRADSSVAYVDAGPAANSFYHTKIGSVSR